MPRQENMNGLRAHGQVVDGVLRRLAAAFVAVEALVLLTGAVVLVNEARSADSPASGIGLGLVAAGVGLALAGCARGLLHGAGWTRGPVITWQLLQAGVGMPVTASAYWYFGLPILLTAAVVGFLVVGCHVLDREERPTTG